MGKIQKVIGLMSGTSLDGVDAALLETDGRGVAIAGPALTMPYQPYQRAILRAALAEAPLVPFGVRTPGIRRAEQVVNTVHAQAVKALKQKVGLVPSQIALIGFHGQTILHRPHLRQTWQIGYGHALAQMTRIAVVNGFRTADVLAGGQGAPLVPLYHAALARQTRFDLPLAVVNIGGVANITYIDGDTVLAFDTGPGNAPIDDWMQRHVGKPVDANGDFARTGKVDGDVLAKMLENSFFDRTPPKSLDRMDFGVAAVEGLSPADGAATLTAFTAASIARAREHFPHPAATWIICGGGRHNATLMDMLRMRVNAQVLKSEAAGWDGDALEAQAFAYLAVRAKEHLPLSLPTTTGVPLPVMGGRYNRR